VSERGIGADPAKVKAIVNLCRHLVTSKSCVVCRGGSSLWSQKLELDVNPFPVKTRTLFGRQSKHKERGFYSFWSYSRTQNYRRTDALYYIWKWNDLVDSSKTGSIISSLRRINENSGFFLKTRDVKAIDIQSMVSGSLVLAHRTSRSVPYWVKACRSKGKKKYRMLNHYCQKSFSSRRCKTKLKSSSAQV